MDMLNSFATHQYIVLYVLIEYKALYSWKSDDNRFFNYMNLEYFNDSNAQIQGRPN